MGVTGMKYVKGFALALLLSAMATTAQADGGKFFPFTCGLQLGSGPRIQKTDPEPDKPRVSAANPAVKSIAANGSGLTAFTGAKPNNNIGRRRMPPTFTLAKIGCSWR